MSSRQKSLWRHQGVVTYYDENGTRSSPGGDRKRFFMANIREKNRKSGVKATPAEAAADAPAASRTIPQSSSAALDAAERAKPSKVPTGKPETAAPKAAAKAATPPEATPARRRSRDGGRPAAP